MPEIVVGVDGSGHSQRALGWAVREAAVRQCALTVVVVHELFRGYAALGAADADHADLAWRVDAAARRDIDEVLASLGEVRPESVAVEVRTGIPAEELLGVAKDADMIVMGTRGAGGFTKLLMGSVSAQVTQYARCPVVVIPPESRF
jgi:nucleotide-binding universal stress UspA family protein